MQPPSFWTNPPDAPGIRAQLLRPLGAVTAMATRARVARSARIRPKAQVICVGNLNAGGTGKTPTVIALTLALLARRAKVGILSRGYGGRLEGPVQVDPAQHSADDVGDEPLLMAAFAPVWIAKDRAEGARAADAEELDVLILDDGFQNPGVAKDLSLIVVDAAVGFGNGLCLPAGPLREPVAAGMQRADAVISIGGTEAQAGLMQVWGPALVKPVFNGVLEPLPTGMEWHGARVLAFAGIGRPEKFFATLEGLGAEVVERVALSDHQSLSSRLMARLKADAQRMGAQLVTTEKDAVRLSQSDRLDVLTLPVRLVFEDAEAVEGVLDRVLG